MITAVAKACNRFFLKPLGDVWGMLWGNIIDLLPVLFILRESSLPYACSTSLIVKPVDQFTTEKSCFTKYVLPLAPCPLLRTTELTFCNTIGLSNLNQ